MLEEELSGTLSRIKFVQSKVPNAFLNLYKCTLGTKDNAYGDSESPVIETTFDNDYTHIFCDLPKWYMYRNLVSKFIGLKAET